MTNGARTRGHAPPYVSYKSWDTFLAFVRSNLTPAPEQLDTSVWQGSPFSGSTRSGLVGALLFLGLIDVLGKVSPDLNVIAEAAETTEDKRRVLPDIYNERYAPLLVHVDLERATRQQIRTAFQSAGSAGETAEKAVSFFLSFARDAGIELHHSLFSRGPGTRPRQTKSSKRKTSDAQSEKIDAIPKRTAMPENPRPPVETASNLSLIHI